MITDFTVSIKFKGQFNDKIDNHYGHTGGFVNLPDCGFIYGTLAKVKAGSTAKVKRFIDKAIRNIENNKKMLIVCKSGHVLVVAYDDGWFYSIASKGRQHDYAGSCTTSGTFEDCCEAARNHAEQCFEGVAWENRI